MYEYILSRLTVCIAKDRSAFQWAQNIIKFLPVSVRVSFHWPLSIV